MAWFSIAPDDGSGSYGEYVAEAVALLDQTGLKYRLGALGATEGELERKVESVRRRHKDLAR